MRMTLYGTRFSLESKSREKGNGNNMEILSNEDKKGFTSLFMLARNLSYVSISLIFTLHQPQTIWRVFMQSWWAKFWYSGKLYSLTSEYLQCSFVCSYFSSVTWLWLDQIFQNSRAKPRYFPHRNCSSTAEKA